MAKEADLLKKQLGKRIKELRIKGNYKSQESFAFEAGIPRALYSRYEVGANITMVNLAKIVRQHKITFEEFFSKGF